ncbi:hypothetical protein GCM10010350_01420 [Streptomyces galilaeus]|nr:hypothetical protein GCM10010350_01420 [Streptomyces galilaeus]
MPQEVPLRGLQEGRTIALDIRAGLTSLLSAGGHASSCLRCTRTQQKRMLPPYRFERKAEAASGQMGERSTEPGPGRAATLDEAGALEQPYRGFSVGGHQFP